MRKGIILSLFWLIIFLCLCPHVPARDIEREAARITRIKGTVMIYQDQGKTWSVARKGMIVCLKDKVKTLSGSEVDLFIQDVAIVRLKENTIFKLAAIKGRPATIDSSSKALVEKSLLAQEEKDILELLKGKLLLWVKHVLQGTTFEVITPIGVAGVKGTRFLVHAPDEDITIVAVLEGIIEAKNILMPDKAVLLKKKEFSIIRRGAYPTEPETVKENLYDELKESLELRLSRQEMGFIRKPGSRYDYPGFLYFFFC